MVQGGSCKPCNWRDSILNMCDSINAGCDSCSYSLLMDLDKKDNDLAWLTQQLQSISLDSGSHTLNIWEANVYESKILVGSYSAAVRHLDPKVKQLEEDMNVVGEDLSHLIDETLQTESHLEKVLQNVNGAILEADDEAASLLTVIRDLTKQLSEVKPGGSITLSENDKVRMMEEAQRMVQEVRERGCTAQRASEQEEARNLLNLIRDNMAVPMETVPPVLSQTSDSLMSSDSALRDLSGLLSEAEDRVDRTPGLNLKSHASLQHLQHLQTQMERARDTLLPATVMTKHLLKNVTDTFLMLEEIKKVSWRLSPPRLHGTSFETAQTEFSVCELQEFENHAAPVDGARQEVFRKLNMILHIRAKVDLVTKAEERAQQLHTAAAGFQQARHDATNSTERLRVPHQGAYNNIISVIDETEMAADQSREAAEGALKDVKEGGEVNRAEGLKDNSTHVQAEANNTQKDLETLSHTVNTSKGRVEEQKGKRELLRTVISAVSDDLKTIRGDDTKVLIESVKTAATASNSTVRNITERLRNISQEVERITSPSVVVNMEDKLTDAERALENLNASLPVLTNTLSDVEALIRKAPPSANMTESIRRIRDLIEETRNFVNRLSIATTFSGKGHVELRPPENLEDIKAFTAVDLLLNHRGNNPSKADRRRRRRQDKRRDVNLFVFYLGNKDASGDYIGMAIRHSVLICVYKLGGVVHQVETSQITTSTNVNSSDFDRVVFHRVYQDAEVNITKNFTSQMPVSLAPNYNLPNTTTGVLDLDVNSVVVYVGGYPDDFTPPLELRYAKYRGAMKLSYINDNPVCLFNYKHAVNMDAKQPHIKIPQSEVSDYYNGAGYRLAFIKEPDKKTRRLFRFHTNSREADALLFYIGDEESFFWLHVERGFLVLQGRQDGRELRAQTAEKVSLIDKSFAITTADRFIVQYGRQQISTAHIPTNYRSYYVGGLPARLRQRHNITAPPLRGCVDHLTADGEIVEYNRTLGVSDGCPVPLLGVRAAPLSSALSIDSLFVEDERPVRVSLGFRSSDRHGVLLSASSQDLRLSLADGCVVFSSSDFTLKSDKRYSDGSWHYLSAVKRPTGLELSIDNVKVIQGQSHHVRPEHQNSPGEKFKAWISNLYTRRPELSFIPVDLSSFSLTGDTVLGPSGLRAPQEHQSHKPVQPPARIPCGNRGAHRGEHQLYDEDSWLSYTLPQHDLNYRPHFSLDVKTESSKGLILQVAGRGVVPLLALFMANGKIKMSLGQNRIIQHRQKSNDGTWHRVELSVEKSTFHLLVDGFRVTDGHLPDNEGSSLDLLTPVHLGVDPTGRTIKELNVPMNSITGCIRDFKVNNMAVGEPQRSHKTLPCPDSLTELGTYFGGGHIVLDNYFSVGSHFVLSFELRPQYRSGLLFHVGSDKAGLDVFLMENKVGVKVDNGSGAVSVSVTPRGSLCDGKFHMVTVSKQHEVIKLVVDSVSEQKAVPFASVSHSQDSLYIGGTTKSRHVPVSSPFVGCLRNIKVNDWPVASETQPRVVDPVSIDGCPKH
ncbi:laminin subunit alpha-3 isoform X1 [Seriola aureovittata]|uniref:laminin subunit alpha-3 isoform X1 n=1 Tax=Seriola aureovittata TaxID=2871759 RepID=UPI0024BDBCDB|nr:laminin subunit alpha-3 isoform X1 [Seriola aureovittata]XP_056233587.1 laminin subunit alpha-3 isoform X1 [Seriola aureovittata]